MNPLAAALGASLFLSVAAISIRAEEVSPAESAWRQVVSEHFAVCYEPGSLAERDRSMLQHRLEAHYERLAGIYGIRPEGRISYYFHSNPISHEGKMLWGFVNSGTSIIQVVYSHDMKDTSPHELRHYFHAKANPKAPKFFDEGSANIDVNIRGYDAHQLLAARFPNGPSQSLEKYIREMTFQYTQEQALAAYSFCNYLATLLGDEGFGRFYRAVTLENFQEELLERTGKSLRGLETEWRQTVKETPVPEALKAMVRERRTRVVGELR